MTLQFVNYNPTTGLIYQSGSCPNMDCRPTGPDGSAWIYGVEVPDPEFARVNTITGTVSTYTPSATSRDVNVERDRRIALGFQFDGKLFAADMVNINGAISSAMAHPDAEFQWIAIDNTILTMDARTMIMFGQTAMAFVSDYRLSARAIKDRVLAGEPITITDNALWPGATET